MQKQVLYNTGNNILFDKINPGENFLILYNNTNNHKQIFRNFIKQMANNNSVLFYVAHRTNDLTFDYDVQKFSFNIISENVINDLKEQLDKRFKEIKKNGKDLLLIADWSKANLDDCNIFIPLLEHLIKKSQELNIHGWENKYKKNKKIVQKNHFILVNAFETTKLNTDFFQKILSLHKRVYFLQENFNAFLLPTILPSSETLFPKYQVLPMEILEKLVKNNLELIILAFLEKGSKSGYQILKDIANQFHCVLSQGTLYPLLYQLEKKNKITKQKGKGKEVIYTLNQETKDYFKSKKETCLKSYEHLANFLK